MNSIFNTFKKCCLLPALLLALAAFDNNLLAQDDCCDQGDKPKALTMEYVGGNCSNSNDSQGSKSVCTNFGGGLASPSSVYIVVSESSSGGTSYFSGNVSLNSTFTADNGGSKFPSKIFFRVFSSQGGTLLQRNEVHTSCSAPLVSGEQFGGLLLTGITFLDGTNCGPPTPPTPPEVCPAPVINVQQGQICEGDQIVFEAPDLGYPCLMYVWDFGFSANPPVATGKGPHVVTFNSDGVFAISLTIDNGCDGSGGGNSGGNNGSGGSGSGGSGSGGSGSGGSGSGGSGSGGSGSGGSGSGGSGSGGSGSGGSGSGGSGSGGSGNNAGPAIGLICPTPCGDFDNNSGGSGSGGSGSGGSGSGGSGSGGSGSGGSGSGGSGSGGSGSGGSNNPCDQGSGSGNNGSGGSGSGGSGSGGSGSGGSGSGGSGSGGSGSGGSGSGGSGSGNSGTNGNNGNNGNVFCVECRNTTTITIVVEDCTPDLGSIGDKVFNDLDNDGFQDPNEPGVPNVTVQLKDCSNNVLDTDVTDNNGIYGFDNLPEGCYRIGVVLPNGFQFSPANQAGDAVDSDIIPATAMTGDIDLGPGENDPTNDAGIFLPTPQLGSIGDKVFNDLDNDGFQDPNEPGVPNVTVQLKDCNNNVINTDVTDSNGIYGFDNLPAGCYRIGVVLPTGFQFSPPNQAGDPVDSDIIPATSMTGDIDLGPGENDPTNDAGIFQPTIPQKGKIGDRVWADANSNGIQDPGELGIPNAFVMLTTCNGNFIGFKFTDPNGNFCFTDLDAGSYRVFFANPNGSVYMATLVNQGGNGALDNDAGLDGKTPCIQLGQGEINNDVDAGFKPIGGGPQLGSIGDFVWLDLDGDGFQDPSEPGVPDVPVQLKDCSNNVLQTTTTNGQGRYSFNNLNAGCYRIGVTLPGGFQFSPQDQNGDNNDSDINPGTAMTGNIDLSQGENDQTNDAGILPTPPQLGSIGDKVFNDLNGNGIQDPGEPGIPNVTVQLKNCSNNILTTVATDGNGIYTFSNLNAGCYRIGVILPSGFTFSPANQGGDTVDSDINPGNAMTGNVNLAQGENNPNVDAGLVSQPAPCDNLTSGGKIGFGNSCVGSFEICNANGGNGPIIGNCQSPAGGSGAMEVIWIRNNVDCNPIGVTVEQMINDPSSTPWQIVQGATGLTLDPGFVDRTTCYQRCVRRAGCTIYAGESNIVQISVNPNCGSAGPDCSNISISVGGGAINVSGLNGAPVTSVQIFTAGWQPVFTCYNDCGGNSVSVPVGPGGYIVKVKYAKANWTPICEVNENVFVANPLIADSNFDFEAVKYDEHAELIWLHNKGEKVVDYTVERSNDGVNFTDVTVQASKGGSGQEVYNGYDLSPISGDNYYRIRMDLIDGSVGYSDIQLIHYPDLVDFTIFPNPANEFTKLNLETLVGKKDVQVTIYNNLGVRVQHVQLEEVYSKYYQLDLRGLKEGHYIVWIAMPDSKPLAKQLMIGKI